MLPIENLRDGVSKQYAGHLHGSYLVHDNDVSRSLRRAFQRNDTNPLQVLRYYPIRADSGTCLGVFSGQPSFIARGEVCDLEAHSLVLLPELACSDSLDTPSLSGIMCAQTVDDRCLADSRQTGQEDNLQPATFAVG